MTTYTHEELPHRSLRCHWPQIFTERRPLNHYSRESENLPFIDFVRSKSFYGEEGEGDMSDEDEDGSDDEEEEEEEEDEETEDVNQDDKVSSEKSIVRIFMEGMIGDQETLLYPDQVEQVASFYEQRDLEELETKVGQDRKFVALLDDRNICGAVQPNCGRSPCTGHSRPHLGPLTPERLSKELERKRFKLKSDQDAATYASESLECDAERRTIFVVGLDSSTIKALTRTASFFQTLALRDLLYKHLTGKTSIGVTIPPRGFRTFTLEYHIPYFALRESKVLLRDTRMKLGGKPLRESWKLPSLSNQLNPTASIVDVPCLYEAQMSVVVTGRCHWVWVAYGFFDTYFEGEDMVAWYDRMDVGGGRTDPLAAGLIAADRPIWTPREYFFKVLEIRINQVLREWYGIFHWIEKEVKQSRTHHVFPQWPNDSKTKQKVREFSMWNAQMVKLLRQLISGLSDIVAAWDQFRRKEIGYFLYDGEPPTASSSLKSSLAAVDKTFSDLQAPLRKFEYLRQELCENLERNLEMNPKVSWLDYLPFLKGKIETVSNNPKTSALYHQLISRNSEIRLLKFMAPWTGVTLTCSLVTTPLPKAPEYVALSYHWGKQTNQVTIRLNNFDVKVTTNLYEALLRLRAEGVQYVWADALCINQQDFDERSFQVARMGAIFQKACQVAAWLGAEPRVSEEMRLLQCSTSYVALDQYPNITSPAMFDELLSRPYWGRVWVIQEVALASDVVVYFGRFKISWDEFVSRCGLRVESTTLSPDPSDDSARGIVTLLQFRRDNLADRPISFPEALYKSRSSLSTDPRDKLFAILGLSFNGKNFIPEPNYMTSAGEIFTEFTTALIKSRGILDYIYLKSTSRKDSNKMPSWVPDWADLDDAVARRQFDYIIQTRSRDPEYNQFELKNTISISETELRATGMVVDTVEGLGRIFVGGRGVEAPTIAKSQSKARLDLVLEGAGTVYETITGVGLLSERAYDDKDQYYADLDGSWSDDQTGEHERLPRHELDTTPELLALIDAWLAINSSFNIGGRDLRYWWKMLNLRGSRIGDVPRIENHFYNSIQCGMRLLATEKGHLGWIHPQAREGDRIVRIFGCGQHVVLRATQNRYRLVGDAILSGVEISNQKYKGFKIENLRIF